MTKDGDEIFVETFLNDGYKGIVEGRKLFNIDGNAVLKQIDFAKEGGICQEFVGEKEPDGERGLRCKFCENFIGKVDVCETFEIVYDAEKNAVQRQFAGGTG